MMLLFVLLQWENRGFLIFQWTQIQCYTQVVALPDLREQSGVEAVFRNQGAMGGHVFIGFAAGGRWTLSYILRHMCDPYDPLPRAIGLSRWEGTFYLRCHQSALIVLTLWFLETVCLVCLHTQTTHSHLSESDEITFSHLKWVKNFFKDSFNPDICGGQLPFTQICLISCYIRHHPSLCSQLT